MNVWAGDSSAGSSAQTLRWELRNFTRRNEMSHQCEINERRAWEIYREWWSITQGDEAYGDNEEDELHAELSANEREMQALLEEVDLAIDERGQQSWQ